MKIKTLGAKNWYSCQLDRVDAAFRELGYDLVSDDFNDKVELIYANDPGGFDKAIKHKQQFGGKLILNILDRPWHCKEINEWDARVKEQLKQADAVTTISKYTQSQVKQHLGFDSEVIYQPIKPVFKIEKVEKDIDFLMVGRLRDANKRAILAYKVLNLKENQNRIFVSCGGEPPGFGNHMGVVSDGELNCLYNRTKIVFAFGKVEGIALQIPESLCSGTPVVTLSDNETNFEFCPAKLIANPNALSINLKINEILDNYDFYLKYIEDYKSEYAVKFSPRSVATNILNLI